MRIPRVYQAKTLNVGEEIALTKEASHHLIQVLRLKAGEKIIIFNGDGQEFLGEIKIAKAAQTIAQISELSPLKAVASLTLHLAQGISRGEKMDLTLQKAVELGVTEITPLITQRCGVQLSAERWEKRMQHWHKIIIAACEQSGRTVIPVINSPLYLLAWVAQPRAGWQFVLNPHQGAGLKEISSRPQDICLLVGPEGGLDDSEIKLAREAGFVNLNLGPRILRTETAAIAALAILQFYFGDMG